MHARGHVRHNSAFCRRRSKDDGVSYDKQLKSSNLDVTKSWMILLTVVIAVDYCNDSVKLNLMYKCKNMIYEGRKYCRHRTDMTFVQSEMQFVDMAKRFSKLTFVYRLVHRGMLTNVCIRQDYGCNRSDNHASRPWYDKAEIGAILDNVIIFKHEGKERSDYQWRLSCFC